MRILSVGNMYPPQNLGGYELVWREWVADALAAGHEVRVLTTDAEIGSAAGGDGAEPGDVRRELRWYWQEYGWPRASARRRWAIERHNARVFERTLAEFRPDAVTWWAMAGMSLSPIERVRRAGVPGVAVVYDYWLEYGPHVDAWARGFLTRPRAARLVSALTGQITQVDLVTGVHYVFGSDFVRRRGEAAWPTMRDSEVIRRAPPGVELFRAGPPPGEWGGRLLFVGRVNRDKGVHLAIEALAHLDPGTTLTIDGPGDAADLAEFTALVAEHGLTERVTFQRSARADLPAVYAAADAVLFTSVWAEPWGLVPLEAMAVGTPVVATGAGGSGEYLDEGQNALRFDPAEGPRALAARVRELAADADLRARLHAGGQRTVAEIASEGFNARVLAAVERAAAAHG